MKAVPVVMLYGVGPVQCPLAECTHVLFHPPSRSQPIALPVILSGTRAGTNCWTWNGDTEKPTLKPSVLSFNELWRCHSWINDGKAVFLSDCSHEFAGREMVLLDVEPPQNSQPDGPV